MLPPDESRLVAQLVQKMTVEDRIATARACLNASSLEDLPRWVKMLLKRYGLNDL